MASEAIERKEKQHEQNKQNEKGLFYKIKDMIFKSSDKKPNQVDTRKAPSIKELTEGVKRALDLVKFEPGGSKMIVCEIAMKELEEEFQHLINAFQRNPEGASSGASVYKSLQDILDYACELKSMACKESKQTCEVMKSTISAGVEQNEVQQTETNNKKTKTVTVDVEQSATTKSAGEERDGLPQNKSNDKATKTETVYAQPAAMTNSVGVEQDELQQTDPNDKNTKTVTVDAEQSATTKSAGEEQDGLKHDESNDKETRTVTADIQQTVTKYHTFDERNGSDNCQSTDKKLLMQKQSENELNNSQEIEPTCEQKKTVVREQPEPLKDDQTIDPLLRLETKLSITTLQAKLAENGFERVMADVHVFNDNDVTGSNLIMVMYINDSRRQDNLANASIKEIQGERSDRILFAVVNCEKNRLLPFSSSKSELKVSGDLGLFHEFVDIAFGKDDMAGVIYNCEMNKVFELVKKGILGSNLPGACEN